jgi:haloalkane dehalogenase
MSVNLLMETPLFEDLGTVRLAYRKVGRGEPLLLVHGWPLSGLTYRKVLPALCERFTCYVVDLPGAGETEWTAETDFRFAGQTETLRRFIDRLGLESLAVVAQDTGATIARQLALTAGGRVKRLAMLNTEIPHHRPPWIRTYQTLSYLPLATRTFQALLGSRAYCRSSLGFGGVFKDLSLLEGEFHACFIEPLIQSSRRMEGQIRYLRGIDWELVDSLATRHRELEMPVLLLWGEEDETFPIARAREMLGQLPKGELVPISGAKLLLHEEQPERVGEELLRFLA